MKLINIYKNALKQHPNKPAVVCGRHVCSYQELDENVRRYASTLLALGIRQGDRIGLFMPNCLELIYAYLACFLTGAIAAPARHNSKIQEIAWSARHCGIKYFLVDHRLAGEIMEVKKQVPSLEAVYVTGKGRGKAAPGLISFNEKVLQHGTTGTIPELSDHPERPAAIFYTSGSTGKPKGVTHSHKSLYHSAVNRCRTFQHTEGHTFITSSYLCHAAAPSIILLPMLYAGGTAVFIEQFTAETFIHALVSNQATHAAAAPAQWREILDKKGFQKEKPTSLIYAASGGNTVPLKLRQDFYQAAGIRLVSGLGMTECGGYMAAPVGEDPPADCLGRPIYDTEVRLVGPDGKDVPVGETGEITVRTSSMMLGYWNDPENTKKSLINGWFHTGDLGRMDNAGNYYFAGRAKDLIIVGTTNVAPGEVEDVLNRHPAILQSVVIGVPDDETGQAVFAYVQFKKGVSQPSKQELTAYAFANLADHKVPKYWHFTEKFEVSGIVDKIDRKKLAEEALTHIAS